MNQTDLKTLLERIEWHEYRHEDGEIVPFCPYCLGDGEANIPGASRYHEFWCKLASFIRENGLPVHRVVQIDEEGKMTKEVDKTWKITGADPKPPEMIKITDGVQPDVSPHIKAQLMEKDKERYRAEGELSLSRILLIGFLVVCFLGLLMKLFKYTGEL